MSQLTAHAPASSSFDPKVGGGPCNSNPNATHPTTARSRTYSPIVPLHLYLDEGSLCIDHLPKDKTSKRRLRKILKLAAQKMATTRAIPNRADLQPYNFAVAGHDGTLCDPDGELFIKPCTKQEIAFYESACKDHPDFAELMPEFYGTLSLSDPNDVQALTENVPTPATEEVLKAAQDAAMIPEVQTEWKPNKNRKIPTNMSVVLKNAAYGHKRPNILDAKLGSRLWADDAPLEKRKRFDEITRVTTNGSHGFRIAGMRVYKGSENPEELDSEGYMVYGKDYGRLTVTPQNVVEEMKRFIFNPQAGIDEDLGKIIAGAFVEDLKHVERVLAAEESRMYSASLLFTFEGDGDALRAAIQSTKEAGQAREEAEQARNEILKKNLPGLSASRVDSGIVMDDSGELIAGTAGGEKYVSIASLDGDIPQILTQLLPSPTEENIKVLELASDGTFVPTAVVDDGTDLDEGFGEDESEFSRLPPIYSIKLIDFAHATWVPGQGPDENVLFGVRSLIKIFEELSDTN
ncbi:hypothetical protein V8F20_007558 [Naviculisporaceae sp. PSN 640]